MDAIIGERKGKYLKAIEIYHIHKINKGRLYMKDTYIGTYNPIFETLHQIAAHTSQSPVQNRTTSA
jgi:hypothetical protein